MTSRDRLPTWIYIIGVTLVGLVIVIGGISETRHGNHPKETSQIEQR